MKYWIAICCSVALAGCVAYEPKPLSPAKTAAGLEARGFGDAGLKAFLGKNLGHEVKDWPPRSLDLQTLTWVAFYYNPGLEVARAEWHEAQAGIKTAAARPNPTVSVTPGYDVNAASGVVPWFPALDFDVPVETAGKRAKRLAAARDSAESARLNVIATAWQVRSHVRDSLLDCAVARRRLAFLKAQASGLEQTAQLLEQRLGAGTVSRPEVTAARIAANKARMDLSDGQAQLAEALSRLAGAVGIPAAALEGRKLDFNFAQRAAAGLTSAAARRLALQRRPDILGALADYAAAEDSLRLEIARQYPDVHFGPGYQYDQGENKWSLGLSAELPVLNQNQGPIREAKARRATAAARFTELQAGVINELDRALAAYRAALKQSEAGAAVYAAEQKQQQAAAAQFKAGANDRVDWLAAEAETAAAALAQIDGEAKLQEALGALEDAVQSPLTLPPAAARAALAGKNSN
jgi:outer membrane protein, heavy metal efflux system